MRLSRLLALTSAVALLAVAHTPAFALDKVRAAKSVNTAWSFIPLNVGAAHGIWEKYGLEVEISGLGGDAKLQQALTSDSVDFGLGSGPSMALAAKGGQAIAVAAFAGEPRNLAIIVGKDSPIKTVADLKGKKMGRPPRGRSPNGWCSSFRASRAGAMRAFRWSNSARSMPASPRSE